MSLLTLDDLSRLRARADPLADEAVAALYEDGRRLRLADDLLALVRAGASTREPALVRFVEETHAPDVAIHRDVARPGRDAILRHAPVAFLALLTGSLIESFAVGAGAEVLVRTGRLTRDTARRVHETASLVRDIVLPDDHNPALAPGGRAHETLLRVRLLHAVVRRFIRASPSWDSGRHGEPVNQADMLHTLLTFSCVLADGIERLGGALTDEEKESWCQTWRAAGALLGVERPSLFSSWREERLLHALVRRTYRPDEGSRLLTEAVLGAFAGQAPFFLPRAALESISRRLVGDDLADALGLTRSPRWAVVGPALAGAWSLVDVMGRTAPGGRRLGVLAGTAFMEGNRWRILRSMPWPDYRFRTA